MNSAISVHRELICSEVLALELVDLDVAHQSVKAGGEVVELGLQKA